LDKGVKSNLLFAFLVSKDRY